MYFTKRQGEYTIEDYEQFPEDFRCELIDGVIYDMSAAPFIRHQILAGEIMQPLSNYVRENQGKCLVLQSPVDVHLNKQDNKTIKRKKYLEAGVREYWLVDPGTKKITVYQGSENSDFPPTLYTFNDQIPVEIFDGRCIIDMKVIYERFTHYLD